MADVVGKNTPSAAALRNFVDRIERIDEQRKILGEDRTAVFAEAKAGGFNTGGIKYVLKVRKMKPHDRAEAETIRDLYMHSMGMDSEPPLFRQMAALARDITANEKLVEAFKLLVPPNGEIIIKVGGEPLRLFRDKEGNAQVEPYIEPGEIPGISRTPLPAPKKDLPNCSADEAEALGETAAKENLPVIANPFPYGDERRPRWDAGWRKGSGNDGMGPDD